MKWYKLEKDDALEGVQSVRPYLKKNDYCVYAREYKTHTDYRAGETNSLIVNFKKSPSVKNTNQWKHRNNAIVRFRLELEYLFSPVTSDITVTAIPSSKRKDDPEYDNRFEDLFKECQNIYPSKLYRNTLNVEWPVEIKNTVPPSHTLKNRPSPAEIKANYIWKGFKGEPPRKLYVIDDIITQGAHFRAISDFLRDNQYEGQIVGVFWAKAINVDQVI